MSTRDQRSHEAAAEATWEAAHPTPKCAVCDEPMGDEHLAETADGPVYMHEACEPTTDDFRDLIREAHARGQRAILDAWHAGHGQPTGVTYVNGVQYFEGEPRVQSCFRPIVWIGDDGVIEVDWSESFILTHDRALGRDISDTDHPGPVLEERHSNLIESILGPTTPGLTPRSARSEQAAQLRRLADHLEPDEDDEETR